VLYDSLPDEVDLRPLADEFEALVTRTPDDGALTIHGFDSEREMHRLGFSQPVAGSSEVAPSEVDVVLLPGLAFDASGVRLGRGGGHYDRLIPRLRPGCFLVGVVPEALVVDRIPREDHDGLMTHLATESGVREVGMVPPMADDLVAAARDWIAGDPDPETRSELQAILDAGDTAELEARMGTTLRFGTAGIRGEVGAGSNRMNRATVIRVTRGIADYLIEGGRSTRPVVVGFDGREDSERFAEDAVGVLAAAGITTRWFPAVTPTPLIAHAVLKEGATMGVVVTASHNPPADNGYKAYDANGAQIIPLVDSEIAAAIDRAGPAADVPRVERAFEVDDDLTDQVGLEAEERYAAEVMAFRRDPPLREPIRIAYTPLHGVAGPFAVRLLEAGGHGAVHFVAEQWQPDGRFPTVAFPNPEEPGVIDLDEALGTEIAADLVLANDPDGDRLAVSLPTAAGWQALTGNQIGVLLGDFVLERTSGPDRLVVSSVVSSPMLGAVAAHHGARHEVTLTGFKWICNAAIALEEREGLRFVYGYEEALGYTVGPVVRDKDGMSAALWFADLVAMEKARGRTVWDRLRDLYARDGLWVSAPRSVVSEDQAEITAAMDRLGAAHPDSLGGLAVVGVTDYRTGGDRRPFWLPETPLVDLALEGGSRVLVRPSGTEPKLKIYPDVRGDDEAEARRVAAAAGDDLLAYLGWPA
jgi:phosphomannomutase